MTIPKSVTKIGTAFDCVKLKDVYCYAEDVPEAEDYSFFISAVDNDPTLHVPSTSIDKYKKANIWREFRHIVALTDEEIEDYNNNNPVIDNIILTGIEGCYQTQPDSHRSYNGNDVTYKGTYEIQIFDNGDGTYYVDDLLGGWYSQRAGYGSNYAMNGDIAITTDGTVSLKDSHVTGWDDGLINLTGTYDANKLSFTIEAEYVSGMKFFQTWVKSGQIFNSNGINYRIEENHNVSVVDTKKNYSGDVVIPNEVTYNGIKYSVTSIGGAFHNCDELNSVIIPNSITNIAGAFYGCSSLASVDIPNSVTNIDGAFYNCSGPYNCEYTQKCNNN